MGAQAAIIGAGAAVVGAAAGLKKATEPKKKATKPNMKATKPAGQIQQPKSESAIAAEKAQASLAEHREAKKRSFGASFRTRIKARKDKK